MHVGGWVCLFGIQDMNMHMCISRESYQLLFVRSAWSLDIVSPPTPPKSCFTIYAYLCACMQYQLLFVRSVWSLDIMLPPTPSLTRSGWTKSGSSHVRGKQPTSVGVGVGVGNRGGVGVGL